MSGGSRTSGGRGGGRKSGAAARGGPAPRPLLQRPVPPNRRPDAIAAPVRRFECAHYDDCLDQAVRGSWLSWACDACDAYREASTERLAHDVAGLLQIWVEATGESVIDGPGVGGQRPRNPGR